MRLLFRSVLITLLFAFLSGCVTQSSFSHSFSKRVTRAQNEWHFKYRSYFDSAASARAAAQKIQPPLDPAKTQAIMNQIAHVSPLRGYPVRVAIVADAKPNAFTDGTQNIFMTTGLLQLFDRDVNVIASVLAHELGHVLANHLREDRARISALEYVSYLTPALSVLPYGGLYSGAAGAALREGAKMEKFSYSRIQESEADAISAFLTCRAGYKGIGLGSFLDTVKTPAFGMPQTVMIPTSVSAIPVSAAVAALSASPLYRIHPRSESRKKVVQVMQGLCEGWLNENMLSGRNRWIGELYRELDRRSPRS